MVCYGYCRVSTTEQSEEGYSLENQEELITKYCKDHNLDLKQIFTDSGISGRDYKNRQEFNKMLNILKKGDQIVVYSFSRLARNAGQALLIVDQLKKMKCRVISIRERTDDTTPMGKFQVTLALGLAELESDEIGVRTKSVLEKLKKEGRVLGRAPFGWRYMDKLQVENEEEQKVIKTVLLLREKGLSFGKIADQFNASGVPPGEKANKWHGKAIKRIVDRNIVMTQEKG